MKRVFCITLVLCLIASVAMADKIMMRDGTIKKGKIVDENTFSYMLRVDGEDVRIFKDQVATVERTDVEEKPSELLQQLEKEGYVTKEELSHMEGISDEKRGLIIEFLEINGTLQLLKDNKQEVLSKAPMDQYAKIDALLNIDGILDIIVPIYAKYYSTQELRETVAFFKSPIGQKVIHKTPKIMQEVVQASVQYFQKHLQKQ